MRRTELFKRLHCTVQNADVTHSTTWPQQLHRLLGYFELVATHQCDASLWDQNTKYGCNFTLSCSKISLKCTKHIHPLTREVTVSTGQLRYLELVANHWCLFVTSHFWLQYSWKGDSKVTKIRCTSCIEHLCVKLASFNVKSNICTLSNPGTSPHFYSAGPWGKQTKMPTFWLLDFWTVLSVDDGAVQRDIRKREKPDQTCNGSLLCGVGGG